MSEPERPPVPDWQSQKCPACGAKMRPGPGLTVFCTGSPLAPHALFIRYPVEL